MKSPLATFVRFYDSYCGYYGSERNLIVNWIHEIFLNSKEAAIKEDNPNWWDTMRISFSKNYWKAYCKEVQTLENMGAWDIVYHTPYMNVLDSTWSLNL